MFTFGKRAGISLRFYSTNVADKAPTVGFIGLGQMGFPMATNLRKKTLESGSAYYVNDVFQTSTLSFKNAFPDTTVAATPMELAQHASIIVTMLPASAHVRQVYLGKEGILQNVKKGTLLIDSSTIDPRTAKEVAEKAKEKGAIMCDAPVSGGTLGAQAATLTFMVGAESDIHFEQVKPILSKMGKNIVYCGPNGNGQVAKIVNNMLLGISMVAASEAMNLGVRLGMDPKLLAGILNSSSGRCWSTDTYNPCPGVMTGVPSARDYEGGFGVSLMAKDMGLAVTAATEAKSTVALGSLAHQIYTQISSTPGFEKKDFSSVFKWLNDNTKKY